MKQKIGNDNIFLDQPSGELTFGKIFKVLKCSLLRMLVYLLIACVIASSIALVITVANKTEPSVGTTLRYIHKGIDTGLGPDGQPLSIDRIKSTNVLATAIKESNLQDLDKKYKELNASNLAPYISITGVIPPEIYAKIEDLKAQANNDKNVNEQLNNLTYFPNNYVLKLESYDDFGLSEVQAKTLLENIVKAYQEDWNDKYYPAPNVPTTIFEQIINGTSEYEYVEYDDLFNKHINQLNKFINNYAKTSFISIQNIGDGENIKQENVSFSSLLTELEILKTDIQGYNSYVTVNKVYKNQALVKASLENTVKLYTNQMQILESDKENIKQQIADIKPSSSTIDKPNGNSETITKYPESYELLQKMLMSKNMEISECNKLLTSAKSKLDLINNPEAIEGNPVIADALLNKISKSFISLVDKSKRFVADYQENGIITADVTCTSPITRSNRSTISNKVTLVVFLLAAVVAIIAAISVTVGKQKVFAFKKKTESKNCNEENVTQPIVEDEKTPCDDKSDQE